MSTETTTCLPPDSEMVPSSHTSCTPILDLAHRFHLTHPRIGYLCVHGAHEESQRLYPASRMSDIFRLPLGGGVLKFNFTLTYWIRRNDETSEQGQFQPHTDLPHLQSFCLDFYEKNIIAVIKIIGNQYTYLKENDHSRRDAAYHALKAAFPTYECRRSIDHIIDACETARDLFKVLELLSKDVQLPSEILEAHTDTTRKQSICDGRISS
ncbi:PREDICTED: callose synthase 2-like [Camelina sativa]|uniref:Callose synthase 2-like n=1 Tax=Camelina sativa TaxID=90675 RepID=A0ABM0Z4H4_CAMSA|nr:PREDICTED: callose synthase 2-like [Camelina sativa]